MTPRRILVITYPYPPMPSVGGNRWLAMSKYLRRQGHEVTILTTNAFGRGEYDERDDVHRAEDLVAARWLRSVMRRPELPKGGETPVVERPPGGLITRTFVPDHNVATWSPFAARAARKLHAERRFDCVITTSAYESTHVVPLWMGRQRPPWIADFRDGWTFHPWKPPYPLRLQTRLDVRLETKVVRTAQRVVVVERPVGDDFRDRLGIDYAYVPNGWDPDLEAEAQSAEVPPLPTGRVTLLHTGKLTGDWGRSPTPLFDAVHQLRHEDPELAARLLIVLAGRLDTAERDLIDRADLGDSLTHVGMLTRGQSLALQRQADALVIFTSPDLVWELPGKVFEYFGARRPIFALAANNEAARIVQETNTGITVDPRDVPAVTRGLRRLLSGELEDYRPIGMDRFVYPAPAEAMADEIERAIAVS